MKPLCSVCAFRIWKISSCLRMPGRTGDVQLFGDLGELLNAHVLQLADVEPFTPALPLTLTCCCGGRCGGGGAGEDAVAVAGRLRRLRRLRPPSP